MMKCQGCGSELRKGDKFCRICGAKLGAVPAPKPAAKTVSKPAPKPAAKPAVPVAKPTFEKSKVTASGQAVKKLVAKSVPKTSPKPAVKKTEPAELLEMPKIEELGMPEQEKPSAKPAQKSIEKPKPEPSEPVPIKSAPKAAARPAAKPVAKPAAKPEVEIDPSKIKEEEKSWRARRKERYLRRRGEAPEESIRQSFFEESRLSETAPSAPAEKTRARKGAGASSGRKRRYLERRGELVEEAKADMAKTPVSTAAKKSDVSFDDLSKGLDLDDLGEATDLGDLGSLSGLSGLEESDDLDLERLAGVSESPQKIKKVKGMGCPYCGSVKGTVVYCPYCGKGFCSDCSGQVQPKGEMVIYSCPYCGKEVIVKKKK